MKCYTSIEAAVIKKLVRLSKLDNKLFYSGQIAGLGRGFTIFHILSLRLAHLFSLSANSSMTQHDDHLIL